MAKTATSQKTETAIKGGAVTSSKRAAVKADSTNGKTDLDIVKLATAEYKTPQISVRIN